MASGVFPALPLEPVVGGLLSAAKVTNHTGRIDWANGPFGWDSFACPGELILTDLCNGSKNHGPIATGGNRPKDGWPFGIVAQQECLSVGYTIEERNDMVRKQVEIGTGKALERELQTGEAVRSNGRTGTHYLADNDATKTTAAATSVAVGVASLEQALGDCGIGAEGVIHLTRAAASLLGDDLIRDGDQLFTIMGTPVVAGSGYAANVAPSPAGAAGKPANVTAGVLPATGWIYATGPVAVHLGPVEILDEQIDRANNIITVTAARPAAVYWDSCAHFAAEVKYA